MQKQKWYDYVTHEYTDIYTMEDLNDYKATLDNTHYYNCVDNNQGDNFGVGLRTLQEWFDRMLEWTNSDDDLGFQRYLTDALKYGDTPTFLMNLECAWGLCFERDENKKLIIYKREV